MGSQRRGSKFIASADSNARHSLAKSDSSSVKMKSFRPTEPRLLVKMPSPCTVAAMNAVSATHPYSCPANMSRENRGSSGSDAIFLPSGVRFPLISVAPRSCNSRSARLRDSSVGASSQRKALTFPTSEDFSKRTVSARSTRWISGASNSALRAWSASLHRRKARPGAVLPARPVR